MAKYVLLHRGLVLPEIEDDEPELRPRSKKFGGRVFAQDPPKIGHKPLANLGQVEQTRVEWAADLGGSIGNVAPTDIRVARLLLIDNAKNKKRARLNRCGSSEARQRHQNRRDDRAAKCTRRLRPRTNRRIPARSASRTHATQ